MSLINKMLQDLDRRQALATTSDPVVGETRPSPNGKSERHQWRWAIIAIVLILVLAGGVWMAMQLKFKPLAPPPANQAAPTIAPVQPPAPVAEPSAPPAPVAEPQAAPPAAIAEPPPPPPMADTLKLALAIETPLIEPAQRRATPKTEPKAAKPPKALDEQVTLDKRDRIPSDVVAAGNDFRRAVALVNQGRVAEAQHLLGAVLKAEPAHADARQVYVSLLLEQGRVEQARRLIEEGLALEPSHVEFALALARILASQREYKGALEVMEKAAPAAATNSNFQTLRAAVLQRLGRHVEAVEAYQSALRGAPQQATSWIGLA